MTTSVRFAGLLPFWLGACLAVVAAVLIWWYYRRESELLAGRLQWLLPALRTLAFLLGVLVLTGPVLKHRQVIGELGRVVLYFDGSDSMTMQDGHMLTGRKLLIASQLGWLAEQRLDTSLLQAADRLSRAVQSCLDQLDTARTEDQSGSVGSGNPDVPSAEQLESVRRDLLAEVTGLSGQLESVRVPGGAGNGGEAALVAVADLLTRDAVHPLEQLSIPDTPESRATAAASLRSIASKSDSIATQLVAQFEAQAELLLNAQDPIIQTAVNQFDAAPRWRRCALELFDSSQGLYDQLCRYHDVQLVRLAGSESVLLDPVDASSSRDSAASWVFVEPFPTSTDLSSGVLATQRGVVMADRDDTGAESSSDAVQAARTAVVLLTDGQHNAGPSPLQVARQLGGQGVPVYCVSFGASRSAPDLAVLALEYPPTVYRKDRVRGVMVVRDRMPPGQSFVAQIRYQSEVVWQQQLLTTNQPERRIEFEFAVDSLVDQLNAPLNSDVVQNSLTFGFEGSVSALATESETRNNQQTMWLAVTRQRSRVLILDGRARWETRYVRNAFERDDKWDVNTVIAPSGAQPTLPRGSQNGMFPDSRERLFDYDLIVLGELAPQLLSGSEQLWLKEFVEMRGGGLILIDGLRGQLRQWAALPVASLLPVAWNGDPLPTEVSSLKLTSQGSATSALKLQMDEVENNRFWTQLPAPQAMVAVEALPGCEVLVEADVAGTLHPAIVTRQTARVGSCTWHSTKLGGGVTKRPTPGTSGFGISWGGS